MQNPTKRHVPVVQLLALGLLVVWVSAVLRPEFGTGGPGRIALDQANLRWHYQTFLVFEQMHKRLPSGTGHRFILEPWIAGVVEHTAGHLARYFAPGSHDPRHAELLAQGVESIWQDLEATTSADTSYAGPGPELVTSRSLQSHGHRPLMADDNEGGPSYRTRTINVLFGDGLVREIKLEEQREYGFDETIPDANFEVGPHSPHPILRLLEK